MAIPHDYTPMSLEDVKAMISKNSSLQEAMAQKGMTPEDLYKFIKADVESTVHIECHIQERREALGLSRNDLAEAAGVSVERIRAYEVGDSMADIYVGLLIAKRLECEVGTLYTVYKMTPQGEEDRGGGTEL